MVEENDLDMITHTVTFRTKHDPGSDEEADFLRAGVALGSLEMVENFQCFRQVSSKSDFTFGFSMEFASQEEYDAYNSHPNHVNFVEERWLNEVEKFIELDYVQHPVPQ